MFVFPGKISSIANSIVLPLCCYLAVVGRLCVSVILEAKPTEALASGRFNLVGQVSG